MTGWRSPLAVVLAPLALGVPVAAAAAERDGKPLFAFADREIVESSGLVDAGDVVHTVNDSGDGPVLYTVDATDGVTAGRTTYAAGAVVDVEALAPGRDGTVWVGDIGDNGASRDSVSLYRVRPGQGGAPRWDLTYPDGPRDAEALLAHPRTGRLFVVSKTVFGGTVYAVPAEAAPGETTTMREFARVTGLVTDGAFLPDGRHVVLRSYGTATVYTFPGFEPRGRVTLPEQRQGEAISVGPGGRVLLSSEGVGSEVLQVVLPPRLTSEPEPGASSPAPSPGASPPATSGADAGEPRERSGPDAHPAAFALRLVAGLVLLGTLGYGLRRTWRGRRG